MERTELEACLQQHGRALHRLAAALLGSNEADDAVQQVWVDALEAPPRRGGPLLGWLRVVLQHAAFRQRRDARRRSVREHAVAAAREAVAPDPAETAAREELVHRLIAAVHALDPATREVVWQRFFGGLPPRAIAAASGLPLATVKSRLHRGLQTLRERLGSRERSDWRDGLAVAFQLEQAGRVLPWQGWWWMAAGAKWAWTAGALALAAWCYWGLEAVPLPIAPSAPVALALPATVAGTPTPTERREVAPPVPVAGVTPANTAGPEPGGGTARIVGRLVDAVTGLPLAGERVSWTRGGQLSGAPEDPGVDSGSDGRFGFDVPEGIEATVLVATPRHVRRWVSPGRLLHSQVEDLGDLALRPGRSLGARVVDADTGMGVADVDLEFGFAHRKLPGGFEGLAMLRSGPDGTCEGAPILPFETCRVFVRGGERELAAPVEFVVTPDAPQVVIVAVRERPSIRGVVVDAEGAPLAGIGLATSAGLAEATTGADGTFRLLRRRPSTETMVTLSLVDTGDCLPHAPLANIPWGMRDLRIELQRPRPFAIEVVGADGTPIEAFGVSIDRPGLGGANRHRLRHRDRHPGGRLEVEGVQRGATSLRVVPLDVAWAPSEGLELGDAEPLRVVVAKRQPCRVLVERGGAPVGGVLVEYVHERRPLSAVHRERLNDPRDRAAPVVPHWPELVAAATTGQDGLAALWCDPGSTAHALRVQVGDDPFLIVRDLVFPADGSPYVVALPEVGRLTGLVVFAGRRRQDVTVRVRAGNAEQLLDPQPDGSFSARPLPAGPCRVDVLLQTGLGKVAVAELGRDVVVAAGKPAEVTIDLGTFAVGAIRGSVFASGALPTGLVVDLVRTSGESVLVQASAAVAADGSFAAEGLWPGTYLAAFRLPAGGQGFVPALQPAPIVLAGGDTAGCELRFVRRKLTVHLVLPDGSPARGYRALARCAGGRWPAVALFAPVLDETLVLDPAPALPIEFGGWAGAGWSDPVQMPEDRTEAEVTVVLPGR